MTATHSTASPRRAPKWVLLYLSTLNFLAITGVAALVSVAALQVFYRYVLGESLFWSEELMRALMVWVAFLMAGVAYSRGELLGMHFILDMLPTAVRRYVELSGRMLIVLFLLTVAWYGFDFVRRTGEQESVALGISVAWIHSSVPFGSLLLAIHVLFADLFRAAFPQDEAPHML